MTSDYILTEEEKVKCECGENIYRLENEKTISNIPKFYICFKCKKISEIGIGEIQTNKNEEDETMSTNEKGIKEIKEHYDEEGVFYGLSEENKIISINRKKMKSTGLFLGTPGSGKTFFAQKEIESVILKYQKDNVVIIDQEGEYEKLTEKYGGENIKISSNSNVRINPFDITSDLKELTEEGEENPVKLKQEFLITFIEVLAQGLTQTEKSIVDRLLTMIYQEYIDNLKKGLILKPTLEKFWEELSAQSEREAMALALRIEIYVKGSLNLFAGETNVEVNKRIVNFNIKELTGDLKTAALLYICDFTFSKMFKNSEIQTWMYIEEISYYFKNAEIEQFFFNFVKRTKLMGGILTGISQNIEDLLRSETAKTILLNSEFLCILRQISSDRKELKNLLNLSEAQIDLVRDNKQGTGFIILEQDKLINLKHPPIYLYEEKNSF